MSKGEETSQQESKKIFVCSANEDEGLLQNLEKHLKVLQEQGFIDVYYDRQISLGVEWADEVNKHLDKADIILLLLSRNFVGSGYCYNIVMKLAMARHQTGSARVIPVILRPVDWEDTPIGKLKALPKDAKPITTWTSRDDAFLDVARSVRKLVEELSTKYEVDPLIPAHSEQFNINKAINFPPIWNVPYEQNPFFTGREDVLRRLHKSFRTDKATTLTRRQAISGLGGIGKTQIAIEYAYKFRNEYQAVLWARADSREVLASDFGAIAYLLNLPEKKGRNQGRIIDAVMRWLQDHSEWLLILDNANDVKVVKEFLPSLNTGHILLTTCAQAMGEMAQPVGVEEMEIEKAALFLLYRARLITKNTSLKGTAPDDLDKAKAIVQLMGGLPLALDQAGAYIEETRCSLSDYLNLYQQQHVEMLKRRGGFSDDHPRPVATTWSLSFEKIKAKPASAELLMFCAFLYPDAIPEEIITKGASGLGPILQDTASDLLELNAAIADLLRFSLIRRDPKAKALTIHRLVQSVLKDNMEEDICRQWAERVVRAVNRALPDVDFVTWPYIQQCLPQVQACIALIKKYNIEFPEAARLLTQTGYYLYERSQYAEAEPLYQKAVEMYEQIMGPEHPNLARSLSLLATLYNARGKYIQAEPLYQRALKIQEKTTGTESRDVITSLNDLMELIEMFNDTTFSANLIVHPASVFKNVSGLL